MLSFVTKEPQIELDNPKRCFKYPFVVANLLSSESEFIHSRLLNKNGNYKLFSILFEYFSKNDLNFTLAAYVNRIITLQFRDYPQQVGEDSLIGRVLNFCLGI